MKYESDLITIVWTDMLFFFKHHDKALVQHNHSNHPNVI